MVGSLSFIMWRNGVSDDRNKKSEESRETHSQAKRRRMLQFNAQDMGTSLCSEDLSSRFLKSLVSDMNFPFLLSQIKRVARLKNSERFVSNMSILQFVMCFYLLCICLLSLHS